MSLILRFQNRRLYLRRYNLKDTGVIAHGKILVLMMTGPCTNTRNMIGNASCPLSTLIENVIYVLRQICP